MSSSSTRNPIHLVTETCKKLRALLEPLTEGDGLADILADILADPNFLRKKREYDNKRLARAMQGAVPLPRGFNPTHHWHKNSYEENDEMDISFDGEDHVTKANRQQKEAPAIYAKAVEDLKTLLARVLFGENEANKTPSARVVFEFEPLENLAIRSRRQTFLYSLLELVSVCPTHVSVVFTTVRADVFTLLERRLASRLSRQRVVIVEPPKTLDDLLGLYNYWLIFPLKEVQEEVRLDAWNSSVSDVLESTDVREFLMSEFEVFSNIPYYQTHLNLLLSGISGESPRMTEDLFISTFRNFLNLDSVGGLGKSLSRTEAIVLAAARNAELSIKGVVTYCFEDILYEYGEIFFHAESGLQTSMRPLLSEHRVERAEVLRAFETLISMGIFQFQGTGKTAGANATTLLSVQHRPVRLTLTANQIKDVLAPRAQEMSFLHSLKFS